MPTTWRSFADRPKLEKPALRTPCIFTAVVNIGSCNGLICFKLDSDEGDWDIDSFSTIFMWNPLVKIFKVLPPCDFKEDSILGFGYHQPTNDYKVVATCYRRGTASRAEVYSLSRDSWKKIDAANVPCVPLGTSVSVNGNIHWLPQELHEEGDGCVVLFNIGEESFGEMVLPDYRPAYPLNQFYMHTQIQVANEALCLLVSHQFKSSFSITYHDVWVMREYGVASSWIKKFSLELKGIRLASVRLSVNAEEVQWKGEPQLVQNTKGGPGLHARNSFGDVTLGSLWTTSIPRGNKGDWNRSVKVLTDALSRFGLRANSNKSLVFLSGSDSDDASELKHLIIATTGFSLGRFPV
ncbi:hypothetical protein RJ640_000653 [Escallonia rubra]|uniref:F-box associated beta-propeller type 1 domain-containing protein n=1 Tax=Escallonia rubra TaxID=112253 RepID=A0AA88QYS2_9ASTE|nr:hypothetical protein RJ640_000653 [Escallonia rubra]